MPASFLCEVCNYGRDVPDDYAGHRVKCPQCAAIVLVPTNGAPAAPPPPLAPMPEKPCPFCLEPIKVEARKCRWCGEVIDRSLAVAIEKARLEEVHRKEEILLRYVPGSRAALVCGLISVVLPIVGVLLGPIAILLGVTATRQARKNPRLEGRGFAKAGIILGCLGIVAAILVIITISPKFHSQD